MGISLNRRFRQNEVFSESVPLEQRKGHKYDVVVVVSSARIAGTPPRAHHKSVNSARLQEIGKKHSRTHSQIYRRGMES
jgi:hypothetical protein